MKKTIFSAFPMMKNNHSISLLLLVAALFVLVGCQRPMGKSFEVGEGTFLLDGRPFVVKAGEVHFPRIPREYWEHRIRMVKAQGMNTVCIYVFWNFHEPQSDQFCFEGQADVRAFVKLCQKHGLYVIVRPGPYCCAEWEMGGLPWWLLKKKDISLRSLDPYFMERVRKFEAALAGQLADLQISRGGPVIMVQVENEFGGYGTDKPYVSAVRDVLREVGWTDVPLFQCDWSSNFEQNALDDLLWTMNFGTGSNIDSQFRRLKELRPSTPLMCSEFWSGWFDNWGRAHETRDAKDMVAGLREMLKKNISFSLYMVHGGTSFGHWAGANSPGYQPDCTSYDYDAPISEAGHPTPKFDELRAMLQRFSDKPLPAVPAMYPVVSFPKIELNEFAPVAYGCGGLSTTDDQRDLTFEYNNLGWGSMYYITRLPEVPVPSVLTLDAHDYAQVFVNDRFVGRTDRRLRETTVALPPVREGDVLRILVEATGRINYGRAIKDFKGIVGDVTVTYADETVILTGWERYPIPDGYDQAVSALDGFAGRRVDEYHQAFADEVKIFGTRGYYRGTFDVKAVGDTWLDMSTWGKGQVYVNGHAIGRFWEIGPQQTLFVPGCWLKRGANEVIVLDVLGPQTAVIEGLDHPILDQLRQPTPVILLQDGETWQGDGPGAVWQGDGPGAL